MGLYKFGSFFSLQPSTASISVNSYGGSVAAHVEEPTIFGFTGNSFGFLIATVFQTIATVIIWKRGL